MSDWDDARSQIDGISIVSMITIGSGQEAEQFVACGALYSIT